MAFILLIIATTMPTISSPAVKQKQKVQNSENNYSHKKIESYRIDRIKFHVAIEKLANDYKIPIGIVINDIVTIEEQDPLISVELSNTTVSEVINKLLSLSPHYKMEIVNSVINIYPSDGENLLFNDIFSAKIDTFIIRKGQPRLSVRESLLNATAVQNIASRYRVSSIVFDFGCGFQTCYIGGNPNFTVALQDMTVLEILNYLLRESGIVFWKAVNVGSHFSIVF
jgi:hypothetical protein